MIVLRQADVYAPQFAGRQDLLIAGGEIVRMAQHLDCGEAVRRQFPYENAGGSAFLFN